MSKAAGSSFLHLIFVFFQLSFVIRMVVGVFLHLTAPYFIQLFPRFSSSYICTYKKPVTLVTCTLSLVDV